MSFRSNTHLLHPNIFPLLAVSIAIICSPLCSAHSSSRSKSIKLEPRAILAATDLWSTFYSDFSVLKVAFKGRAPGDTSKFLSASSLYESNAILLALLKSDVYCINNFNNNGRTTN